MNEFFKGHALGNDYIVLDPKKLEFPVTPENVRSICDRHRGIGSDGILLVEDAKDADFGLSVHNPDGSEAQKSGNGLRIFGLYLYATLTTSSRRFSVETGAGLAEVSLETDSEGDVSSASVSMGRATFDPQALPCLLEVDELIEQQIVVEGRRLIFTGVNVGNPHCVVFTHGQEWTREELLTLGPKIEHHPLFPQRVNVQLAARMGQNSIGILIWERGAGETLASGTSSCAVAAAGVRLGLVTSPVVIAAPGGVAQVEVDDQLGLRLSGPVTEIARGTFSRSMVKLLASM